MKKNLILIIAVAFIGHFANAQTQPAVTIQLQSTTPTSFTVKFTPNEATKQYFILSVDSSQVAWNEKMAQKPIHRLIQDWGIRYTTERTYTWKGFKPNTKYFVYALANDSLNPVHQRISVVTSIVGGTGVAAQTAEVSEITATTAKVVTTPNSETSRYYEHVVEAGMRDTLSLDSIASIIMKINAYNPRYETFTQVWPDLKPNTDHLAISVGFNLNNERGTVTATPFKTLVSSIEAVNPKISLATFPNPALETLIVRCDDMTNVELFDLTGKQLLTQKVTDNHTSINVVNYDAGTYILRVTTKQGVTSAKVVIGVK